MAAIDIAAPLGFGMFALALLYIAYNNREEKKVGYFDFYFGIAMLAIMGMLYMTYSSLNFASSSFASVIFPVMMLAIWIFIFVILIVLAKTFKYFYTVLSGMIGKKWKGG